MSSSGMSATATRPRTGEEHRAASVGPDGRAQVGRRDIDSSPPANTREIDRQDQTDVVWNETISTRATASDSGWRNQLAELRESASQDYEAISPPELFDRPLSDHRISLDRLHDRPGADPAAHDDRAPVSPSLSEGSQDSVERFGARSVYDGDYEPGGPVQQSGATQPFEVPGEIGEEEGFDSVPESDYTEDDVGYNEPEDSEILSSDATGGGDTTLPKAVQAQKCCRTCRDFIPVDGGRQGWCNNRYAFERRQQVEADQLSCRGTFGSWWAPADDWWLERADISHHSTPTPLVQELIRNLRDRQEDGSTSGTQRS